jgi:hypothetical protein
MAKKSIPAPAGGDFIVFASNGSVPDERTSACIRAFLLGIGPLFGSDATYTFHEGYELVEKLALHCELEREIQWNAEQCATVLRFLHVVQPKKVKCYCDGLVNGTENWGYHSVLIFIEHQLWRIAKPRSRKRASKRATAAPLVERAAAVN